MKLYQGLTPNQGRSRRTRATAFAIAIVACLCALVVAGSAFAAPPAAGGEEGKQFNFETDEVTVDVLKPDGATVEILQAKARQSLIRIRMDFINEIVRSAEDI